MEAKERQNVLSWKPLTLLVVLVAAALVGTASGAEPSDDEMRPEGVTCAGFEWMEGVGPVCPVEAGLWEVYAPDGTSLGLTHGTDPMPAPRSEEETEALTGPVQQPACTTSPSSDYYAVVIYARAFDDADRYASLVGALRDEVKKANTHLRIDAGQFDVQADYKVLCTASGDTAVYNAVLPTRRSSATFSTITNDLRNMGYNNNRVKYWVYYDDTSACSCGGTGHVYPDDRLILDNRNNGYSGSIPMFGVTFGYMDYTIMMHENGHNMGAVQKSAPHTTGAYHCTDGNDIMCYNDGGPRGDQYTTSACSRDAFDCDHDDYFHPKPLAGTYLSSHWNLGSTLNRFLTFGTCGLAREGSVLAGAAGVYLSGTTGREETDIPSSCWGRDFVLRSTYSSGDFDVCFYSDDTQLECHLNGGDEAGQVPPGTNKARITLYTGYLEEYTLLTP